MLIQSNAHTEAHFWEICRDPDTGLFTLVLSDGNGIELMMVSRISRDSLSGLGVAIDVALEDAPPVSPKDRMERRLEKIVEAALLVRNCPSAKTP